MSFREPYEIFLSQLYSLPINQSYLPLNFISFQEAHDLLQRKQVDHYTLDPLLQVWAGLPSTPNRIITLHAKNGVNYLVKAQYNSLTQQIFPAI